MKYDVEPNGHLLIIEDKSKSKRQIKLIPCLSIIVLLCAIITPFYLKYKSAKSNTIIEHLLNNQYRVDHSYTGSLLTNCRETWKLVFKTDSDVDYYYIDQVAWEDKSPIFQCTCHYSVKYSIWGDSKIVVNGKKFIIKTDFIGIPSTNYRYGDNYVLYDWTPSSNE